MYPVRDPRQEQLGGVTLGGLGTLEDVQLSDESEEARQMILKASEGPTQVQRP